MKYFQGQSGGQPTPSYADSDDSDTEMGADTNVQDMEEGSSEEEEESSTAPRGTLRTQQVMAAPPVQAPVPPIQAPARDNVTIRKYDPKAAAAIKKKTEDDQFLISPITGEKIPAAKAAEHMKVGLLDPRWVEERDKQINQKAAEEVVYAPGQSIEYSLKQMAERRTDIFGVGNEADQETVIGKKIGEEEARPAEKVTWDGHATSAESAARAARVNVSLDDQIAQIHRQKGLMEESLPKVVVAPPAPAPPVATMVPPMIVGVPMRPAMVVPTPVYVPPAPPVYIQGSAMMEEEEPPNKRSRTEENLIPEDQFLARNPGPVTLSVAVPSVPDKPEWKLDGQMMSLTLPPTETVNTIKQRIMEELGMPQGKQKLQHENIFLKVNYFYHFYFLYQFSQPSFTFLYLNFFP